MQVLSVHEGMDMGIVVTGLVERIEAKQPRYATEAEKTQMRELFEEGVRREVIAKRLGFPVSTVYYHTRLMGKAPPRTYRPASDAWGRELLPHRAYLMGMAVNLTRNLAVAEDMVQETFVRALRSEGRFTPGTSMTAWLGTILKHLCWEHARINKRFVDDPDEVEIKRLSRRPEQQDVIDAKILFAKLQQLPVHQREAIDMICLQGLDYGAAAERAGVPVGTMKSRLNRAREHLMKLMGLDPDDFKEGDAPSV